MSLRYHKTVLADNVNLVAEGSDGSVHLDHLGNMFAIAVNVHHIMALAASSMAGPPAHSRSGFMRASFRLSDLHDCTGNTTSFLTPSECQLRALVISEKEKRNSLSQKYREAERKEANGDFVLNSDRAKSVWAYFFCTVVASPGTSPTSVGAFSPPALLPLLHHYSGIVDSTWFVSGKNLA